MLLYGDVVLKLFVLVVNSVQYKQSKKEDFLTADSVLGVNYLIRIQDSPTGNKQFVETTDPNFVNCEVKWPGTVMAVSTGEFSDPSPVTGMRTWIEESAATFSIGHKWGGRTKA